MDRPLLQEDLGRVGNANDKFVALPLEPQIGRGVDVPAGKGVGHAKNGRQLIHEHAALARQRHILRVRRLRPAAAVVSGDVGGNRRLLAVEPEYF